MIFKNNKTYNILKYLALIVFDAIGVAYKGLAEVWQLPYGEQIMTTCTILSVLLGTLIGVSNYRYNNMDIDTDTTEDDELLVERDDE